MEAKPQVRFPRSYPKVTPRGHAQAIRPDDAQAAALLSTRTKLNPRRGTLRDHHQRKLNPKFTLGTP